MHMNDVPTIIRTYQQMVARCVGALRTHYATADLLPAWHQGTIPEEGQVLGEDGVTYQFRFHGGGCRCKVDGVDVDFDFGPQGRHDGFDAWRLAKYCRSIGVQWDEERINKAI